MELAFLSILSISEAFFPILSGLNLLSNLLTVSALLFIIIVSTLMLNAFLCVGQKALKSGWKYRSASLGIKLENPRLSARLLFPPFYYL